MRDNAQLLVRMVPPRLRHGTFLVDECMQWIDRLRRFDVEAESDEILGEFIKDAADVIKRSRLAMDVIEHFCLLCLDQPNALRQLIAVENLADAIVALEQERLVHTRTPPADALEDFYSFGTYPRKVCSLCDGRHGYFYLGDKRLCAHCLVGVLAGANRLSLATI